jgi:SAM-dependent methyltransferase
MNKLVLKEFLNIYWLRPETAVWRTMDVIMMKDFNFISPSLDLGCGDGLFSYIRGGGDMHLAFDVYSDVNLTDYFNNADVYDHFNQSTLVEIMRKPAYRINAALDHKNNLLEKAKRLDFYDNFIQHDCNNMLPFSDNNFNTVFSNIIYWLDNPRNVLQEINRVLRIGGKAALLLPDKSFKNSSFYNRLYLETFDEQWKWLEKIDRGRVTENMKHMYTSDEWEEMFVKASFKITSHKRHLSKYFISMWDIGLRPIFPLLHKMQSKLRIEDKLEVKKEWIDLFIDFGLSIIENDLQRDENDFTFHYYEIQKNL